MNGELWATLIVAGGLGLGLGVGLGLSALVFRTLRRRLDQYDDDHTDTTDEGTP